MRERLERYYAAHGHAVHISDVRGLAGGWETEVYAFTAADDGHVEQRLIRLYPGDNAAVVCGHEAAAYRDLYAAGYPVPQVFASDVDTAWFGMPFIIMEYVDGRPLGQRMREDETTAPAHVALFCRVVAALHALDARQFSAVAPVPLEALLARYRTVAETTGQTWALPVVAWLMANKPDAAAPSPLHGDFHPDNVLLTDDGRLFVIDWSAFSLGDFRLDLGWLLLLIVTYGYAELRPVIVAEYERAAGRSVAALAYFETVAALRRLLDMAVSFNAGSTSAGMRDDTIALMRGQRDHYTRVYDILRANSGLQLPDVERLLAAF